MLGPRKRDILKAVVDEFTGSAVPVGSQALARRYFVNLSSATIRNELSELSELGYVAQPHTSAGRVPTDRGYRYFVDFLMPDAQVPGPVREFIEVEVRRAPADAQAVTERLATTVAAATGNAAVATAPTGAEARIKHLDLISLEPREALLVLLAEGNVLRHHPFHLEQEAAQEDLSALARRLNDELVSADRVAVDARRKTSAGRLERLVLDNVAAVLATFEHASGAMVVHDGVRNLLRQPEFNEASRLHEVMEVLEETQALAGVLRELTAASDLQIVIGSENPQGQLRSCTVILTTYGPSRKVKGVVGVVGPTRMDYGQVVGRLRVASRAASERLAEL